jgi:hypothetical protein
VTTDRCRSEFLRHRVQSSTAAATACHHFIAFVSKSHCF